MTSASRPPVPRRLTRLAGAARRLRQAPTDGAAFRAAVAAEVARQLREREAEHADLDFALWTLIAGRGRGGDRRLNHGRYGRLHDEIRVLTGVDDARWQLGQAYLSLLDAEARGAGRIAGSTYNILGKLVVPPLMAPPDGPILEIGTLYGLFSPALVRSFRRAGQVRHLTVVDPFAGDQLQGGSPFADASETPITEEVARRNFAEFGLGRDDVRAVVGLSTDAGVRAVAADRTYAVVVVDGDHYEAGVAADLRWVETVLAPGGIAVVDDFGDAKWPGVEKATQDYLADGGRMQLLGTASTSAYLRLPI